MWVSGQSMCSVQSVQVRCQRRQRLGTRRLHLRTCQPIETLKGSLKTVPRFGGQTSSGALMVEDMVVLVGAGTVQHSVAESSMFAERRRRRESLAAIGALDLLAAVGVHPLVAAEVRELRVRFEADLALERLDAAVDVLMLLKSARRGERLAAVGTRMGARAAEGVRRPHVTLQVAWVGERLLTRIADVRLLLLLLLRMVLIQKMRMTSC